MGNIKNIEKHKFKKGQSGNIDGRPKGSKNRSTIIRDMLELMEAVYNPITGKKENLTQIQLGTLAMINKMRKGDVRAYEKLMDYAYPNESNIFPDINIRVEFIDSNTDENK